MTERENPLATGLSAEDLAQMRQIGLRLDRAGRFWHREIEITHARLHTALLSWLDVIDGRNVVRLDEQRFAYVDIEDAHVRARSARWEGSRCWVLWDDGREHELAYGSLSQAVDHAIYVPVRALTGRIGTPAYQVVVERIEEDVTAPGGFVLIADGGRWPIRAAGV
jgi:hypothetical protein